MSQMTVKRLKRLIKRGTASHPSFANGPVSRVMGLAEAWGAADARWKLAANAAFARSIPALRADGTIERYAFTLMPQWAKMRWRDGALQPAKLYLLGHAGFVGQD